VQGSYWRNTSDNALYAASKLIYLPFVLFFEGIAQTSYELDPELYFSNESYNLNILNETMGKTAYDIYRYSHAVVTVFGILGNILVIISILRQKKVLKNNYYFLVLHLAICDLGALIIYLILHINWRLVEEQLFTHSIKYCAFSCIPSFFRVPGIGMMLIIQCFVIVLLCIPLNLTSVDGN
jgi:hypothetical protein